MTAPKAVSVRGGAAGIQAHCADLTELAGIFGSVARYCAVESIDLHRFLAQPAVLGSSVLDPWGAGRFESDLLDALDGRHGVTVLSARCAALDVGLRSAAISYSAADRLAVQVIPAVEGLVELAGIESRPDLIVRDLAAGRSPLQEGSDLLAAHPEMADLAVVLGTRFWADYALVHLVAAWPDGRPMLTRRGVDASPAARRPPRSLHDVMVGLDRRDQAPTGGDIDVRIVTSTGPGGGTRRSVVVDIPGTKNWSLSPIESDPTSMGTNLRAAAGAKTTYGAGVIMALRRAGVSRTEPVLLVGHSQGGMVALGVAGEVRRSGEFDVTHVVTAGSPIGRLPVPAGVQVLAVENDGDVVPHLDGADNPDRANETTVRVHRDTGALLANHDLSRSYVPAAADIDATDDPSVRAYIRGLEPFLTGDDVRTEIFHVERR